MIEGRTDMAAHAEGEMMKRTNRHKGASNCTRSGHRLHVLHLTYGIEADWLADVTSVHGEEGKAHVTTEVLPQHLTFDETDVEVLGTS